MKLKLIFTIIVLHSLLNYVNAQEMIFSVTANANKVGLQNQFQVTFSVQNANQINKFQVPDLKNFIIVGGPMQSSSFSTINGSSSSSISYTYYLQPKAMGKFIIPSAIAVVDGKQIKSNTIEIEVIKGNVQMPNKQKTNPNPFDDPFFNDDPTQQSAPLPRNARPTIKQKPNRIFTQDEIKNKVFARIDLDKTKAYQGQQITASYNIYSQLPLEAGFKKLSSPEGFWSQDYTNEINPQACDKVIENGKEYRKYTLRKVALFATKSGELTIPSVDIQTNIDTGEEQPMEVNNDEDNMISNLFNQLINHTQSVKIPMTISTKAVTVTSLPLPIEKQPKNFSCNVGHFTMEGNLIKSEITTDESTTLQIIIRGDGNIKMITNPQINFTGDFENIEPIITDTLINSNNELSGYKKFSYTLNPRNVGNFQIPPISFNYYNPTTNEYQTLETPAYNINVVAGKNISKHKKIEIPQDIHDIVNDDTMQRSEKNILPENNLYWSAYCLPLLGLLSASIYKKRKNYQIENKNLYSVKNANLLAKQRLSIAYEMLKDNNNNGFYNETSKAIQLYLSDKLNIPLSKLNKEEIAKMLDAQNVNEDTKIKLQHTINYCEQALYATNNENNMQNIYSDSLQIISELENVLS